MTATAVIAVILGAALLGFIAGYTVAERRAEAEHQWQLADIEDRQNEERARRNREFYDRFGGTR